MKIAMMTNNYRPVVGGVPISIHRLSGALRDRGHQVTIFAPSHPDQEPEEDVVRYRSIDRKLPGGVVLPGVLDPVIQREFAWGGYDLIHLHHPVMIGYVGLSLAQRYRVPLAFTYHTRYEQYLHYLKPCAKLEQSAASTLARKAVIAHNRAFTNRCDLVFAPTPMMGDYLAEQGTQAPIAVLPTGLGREDFTWDEGEAEAIRRRHLPREGAALFCCVARLEREKNIPFLLRAMVRLREERGGGFRLLLIGDGSRRKELEGEAVRLGVEDHVHFLGNIPHRQLASYYRACDLFLFASQSETQGLVLLEAMAAALPVVAVEASGVCDVVENGRNGWRVSPEEGAFARQVADAMENPDLLAKLGRGAAATAAGSTAEGMAAAAEGHYRAMLLEKRQADSGEAWRQPFGRRPA